MTFEDYFPIWNKLTDEQKAKIKRSVFTKSVPKGRIIAGANNDCTGLFLIKSGQLRAYILSDEGREITIYRLFERDMCLFSASCMMRSIQFQITIETEKDSEIWVIPVDTYQKLMEESAAVANYTTEVMSTRFTDVMWLIEQVMWKSLDKRLAQFLLEESAIEETATLNITHEVIANHLGTHREVITRMLKYFQNENIVTLSRGVVTINDSNALEKMCDE
jgi:CRP/FNR family transcriptional regulator